MKTTNSANKYKLHATAHSAMHTLIQSVKVFDTKTIFSIKIFVYICNWNGLKTNGKYRVNECQTPMNIKH